MTNPGGATKLVLEPLIASQRTEWQGDARSNLGALIAICDQVMAEVILANSNTELSDHGRRAAISRAAKKAHVALDNWAALVTKLQGRIGPLEQRVLERVEVRPPEQVPERLAWEFKVAEVRAQLRDLDPMQREAIYLQTHDPIVIYAIETAPPMVTLAGPGALPVLAPCVSPERITEAVIARARAAAPPEVAEELESLVALKTMYTTQLETVRQELNQLAPDQGPAANAVAQLAAGKGAHA
jgi:hypothetical protein